MTLTPDVACAALLPTSQGSHARVALFGHVWFLLQSHQQRHQRGHVGPPFLSPRFPSSPRNGPLKGAQCCQCSTCFARSVTKLLLDLACCPKLPLCWLRAASPAGPAVPGVTALPTQGQSQFGWTGDQEREYAMLKAWMRLSMLNPCSFLTVLHVLLSLVFTPGACQAPSTWMQVHSSTEK